MGKIDNTEIQIYDVDTKQEYTVLYVGTELTEFLGCLNAADHIVATANE